MKLSKVVRLQPNKYQEQMFRQFAGTNRFAWNQSKAFYDKMWNDNKEYASVQDMIKNLQDLKHNSSDYAWLNTIPEAITKQAIKDLQKAYKKAYKDRKTHKPDPKNPDKYFPKFKKKGKSKESFFAILSDGQHFGNINKTPEVKRLRKRLKHLQRKISKKYEANVTYDNKGNKVFHKTNNIKKLEKQRKLIYRRISNIQTTYMYEVAKSVMKTKPQTIILEDLNIKGMMQNPKLAKAIQEQNLYKFRQIIAYKGKKNGIRVLLADRWYPSSKMCSCCGNVKTDLKLSDRTYHCDICGFTMDRDENAAINIENCNKFKKIKVA